MSAPEPNPHATAVVLLTKTILSAIEAVEKENWALAEKFAYSAARQARSLLLAERAEEKERVWKAGEGKK